jgi:hypothetical protein
MVAWQNAQETWAVFLATCSFANQFIPLEPSFFMRKKLILREFPHKRFVFRQINANQDLKFTKHLEANPDWRKHKIDEGGSSFYLQGSTGFSCRPVRRSSLLVCPHHVVALSRSTALHL